MKIAFVDHDHINRQPRQRLRSLKPTKSSADDNNAMFHRKRFTRGCRVYTLDTLSMNSYQKTALFTIGATFFLIFVGGLVRAAGAGLGCPDWPHCFGSWIPPTSADQLIGTQYDPAQFNVFQTWLEYVNRLIGVIIGLLIVLTAVRSRHYFKSKPIVFWGSVCAVLLVGFQGWLGGVVVKSELEAWIITAHMVTAMVLVCLLIYLVFVASAEQIRVEVENLRRAELLWLGIGILLILFVQLALGTQVREGIDVAMMLAPDARSTWLDTVGPVDEIHRSFSWVVLVATALLYYLVARWKAPNPLPKLSKLILVFVVAQILFGVGLAYLALPPALQVLHLLFANLTIAATFTFVLIARNAIPVSLSAKDHKQQQQG
jgi:cytochrome c oxidase assembly protein subunit 15